MRHEAAVLGRCMGVLITVGASLLALHMVGCGSSGGSSGGSTASGNGVAVSGSVSVPSDANTSESAPLGKSVGLHKGVELPSADVASLSKDTAVGSGREVTITDAKSGVVLATGTTDSSGGYSLGIPTTTTDCIISVKIDDTTELNRIYTATGSAATGVSVDADTTSASVAVLQKCQEVAGITTDIDISDLPSKCGAAITAGTLIPDAIYTPYLAVIDSGVDAGSADASTGKGAAGAHGLMYREILKNKLRGTGGLQGVDPWDVVRKAYLNADSTALAQMGTYAPTISATVTPTAALAFAKDLGKSMAAVTNDKTTSDKCKGDWTAVSKLYENFDATQATKVLANPDDLQFQLKDSFDNKQTDKLKDKKYTTLFTDACGDKNFSNLKTDDERKAYTKLIYNTDLSTKTAAEAKTIGTGLINTFAAACPSGTCDSTKLTAVTNNPTVYTASILAQPHLYGGTTGSTYATGLINQVGTTDVITGTKPSFTACATASDCGTAVTGTFVCVSNFCQNSATAKPTGDSCAYNGDCISGTCNPVSKICTDPVAVGGTGTTSTIGGTLTTLLANGNSCLAGYQCSSGNCDLASHTCKAVTEVVAVTGTTVKLGGSYKKSSSPSNVLSASVIVTVITGTTVNVSLSEGLYGATSTGSFNSSTNKLTFSMQVYESGSHKTLTCTDVNVQSEGSTLLGMDACTLGSDTKSISHTKS